MCYLEHTKYEKYEKINHKFDQVIALSHYENAYTNKKFGNSKYVPAFHGNKKQKLLSTFGKYALYHGDLRTSDNKKAVAFLIKVFQKISDYTFLIASNNRESFVNIKNQAHLDELLHDAHINVMLSFQQSGTKLKLIYALFNSRFCIINSNIVDYEHVSNICQMAETESNFILAVNRLRLQPY